MDDKINKLYEQEKKDYVDKKISERILEVRQWCKVKAKENLVKIGKEYRKDLEKDIKENLEKELGGKETVTRFKKEINKEKEKAVKRFMKTAEKAEKEYWEKGIKEYIKDYERLDKNRKK